MIVACFKPCLDCIWPYLSSTLGSFLQKNTGDALTWLRNWVVERIPCFGGTDPVVLQPSSSCSIAGVEDTLSKIRHLLDSKEPEFIGIYGMGGVGKTTLLKAINNEFFQTRSGKFDFVFFVTVSNVVNIEKIQKTIGEQLGFSGDKFPTDPEQRSRMLCESLSQKKFLLLLDDLWDRLDLVRVGIPISIISVKGSKIVFTTRLTAVCNAMDAARSKIKVPVLSQEKSWQLFCEKLGKREDEWNEYNKSIAEKIVRRCGGLPLALVTVGRALADSTTQGDWESAFTMLPDLMEDDATTDDSTKVLTVLKFSFDRLKDRRLQECLLYCALYPPGCEIDVQRLTDFWIGEGFLEREDRPWSYNETRNYGHATITDLKAACLLEDGTEIGQYVKLHDVVREMILRITAPSFNEEKNVFLVPSPQNVMQALVQKIWINATRISFMWGVLERLPDTPHCHTLRTLVLYENKYLSRIPSGFFQFMPLLTVLDLSKTGIRHLPQEIGLLVELRYLNLSATKLESLPKEVGKLTKLRILDLDSTNSLRSISKEAISSLSCLQSLGTDGSGYEWTVGRMGDDVKSGGDDACLADLECLEQLSDIGFLRIIIKCNEDLNALLHFGRLRSLLKGLTISLENVLSFDMSDFLGAFRGLETIVFHECDALGKVILPVDMPTKLEKLFFFGLPRATFFVREPKKVVTFTNLKLLELQLCHTLIETTWIGELPYLESAYLIGCRRMVEVIASTSTDYERDSFFPRLTHLHLKELHSLKNICEKPLSLRSLTKLEVLDCQMLRMLPFDRNSAQNIKIISGHHEWWDNLAWENEDIRKTFMPYFEENNGGNRFSRGSIYRKRFLNPESRG